MKKITTLLALFALTAALHGAQYNLFVHIPAGIDTHAVTDVDSLTFGYNMPVSSSSEQMMYIHGAAGTDTVTVTGMDSITFGAIPVAAGSLGTIDPSGWKFTDAHDLTGDYDPYSAPEILTVARHGFDSNGAAITQYDDVIKMKRLRLPYPNGTVLTDREVALSEWIFAGDVVAGMANNSTCAYPLPNGRWLNPEWEIVQNDSLTLRFFAAHAYGRNGTPLACIKFEATDGVTTTPRVTVAALTSYRSPVSGLYVPCYEATVDISTLSDGEVTANAILYPHVGDTPFNVATDGDPWPTPSYVTVQKHLKATGGTGLRYAYVDGAGSGGSEATATDIATAKTTPYAEPMAAIADLETDQGGSLSACILMLAASTVNEFGRYDTRTVGRIPFYITGEGTDTTRAVYTLPAGTTGSLDMSADRLVLDNLIIRQTTASSTMFNNRAHQEPFVDGVSGPYHHRLIIKNSLLDANGLTQAAPWTYVGIVNLYQSGSNYTDGLYPVLGRDTYCAHMNLVGCRNFGSKAVYWSVGTDNGWGPASMGGAGFHLATARTEDNGATLEPVKGPLFAYNRVETKDQLNCLKTDDCWHGPEGAHYIGNVMANITDGDISEFYGAAPSTLNDRSTLENIVVQHNTGAGGGWGGPSDNKAGGVDPVFYWQFFWRGNIAWTIRLPADYRNKNTGGDIVPDGTQVRNWPQRFGTGYSWSVAYELPESPVSSETGYDKEAGDVLPLHSLYTTLSEDRFPGFVNDASTSGTDDHVNGDYTVLDDSNGANLIANIHRMPAEALSYGFDVFGRPLPMVSGNNPAYLTDGALPGGVQFPAVR